MSCTCFITYKFEIILNNFFIILCIEREFGWFVYKIFPNTKLKPIIKIIGNNKFKTMRNGEASSTIRRRQIQMDYGNVIRNI